MGEGSGQISEVSTMMNTERLRKAFPQDWQAILKGCEGDTELVEICEDLDQLYADIEKAECESKFMSESLKADVRGSIDALVQEIREKLNLG